MGLAEEQSYKSVAIKSSASNQSVMAKDFT